MLTFILGISPIKSVSAQSLSNQIEDQYNLCVGAEVMSPAFFWSGQLQALPAPIQIDLDVGISAANCLTQETGAFWAYDPERNRFSTDKWYEQALDAQNRAVQLRQQELMLIQAREATAQVWVATIDACVSLYRANSVAALTNEVCHPIFLEIGLPRD